MNYKLMFFAAAIIGLSSCENQRTAGVYTEVDTTVYSFENRQNNADSLHNAFVNFWNNRDSANINNSIADDAIFLGDNGHTLNGREDIIARWVRTNLPITSNLQTDVIQQDSGPLLAYSSGTWSLEADTMQANNQMRMQNQNATNQGVNPNDTNQMNQQGMQQNQGRNQTNPQASQQQQQQQQQDFQSQNMNQNRRLVQQRGNYTIVWRKDLNANTNNNNTADTANRNNQWKIALLNITNENSMQNMQNAQNQQNMRNQQNMQNQQNRGNQQY